MCARRLYTVFALLAAASAGLGRPAQAGQCNCGYFTAAVGLGHCQACGQDCQSTLVTSGNTCTTGPIGNPGDTCESEYKYGRWTGANCDPNPCETQTQYRVTSANGGCAGLQAQGWVSCTGGIG